MEVHTFPGVVGMDAFRAKSVIRMKLAAKGYYDVVFSEVAYKKTQYSFKPYSNMNECILLIDEKFDEVTVTPRFAGKRRSEDELW